MIAPVIRPRSHWFVKTLAALVILIPCLLGFGNKFIELIDVYRTDSEGAFAIAPITNYLLASVGFLLLFGWAAANGMFHNIEGPKQTMLDNEVRLDSPARRIFTHKESGNGRN